MSNTTPPINALASEQCSDTSCGACQGPLLPRYFAVNGQDICQRCWVKLERSTARPLAATLLAAALSTGLYYALYAALDGFRFQLIPIVAGVLVGTAVRRTCGLYQPTWLRLSAVVATYVATTLTYIPVLLSQAHVPDGFPVVFEALRLPFVMARHLLVELDKNVVTLVLLGAGLHEAYAFSSKAALKVDGPYDVGAREPHPDITPDSTAAAVADSH